MASLRFCWWINRAGWATTMPVRPDGPLLAADPNCFAHFKATKLAAASARPVQPRGRSFSVSLSRRREKDGAFPGIVQVAVIVLQRAQNKRAIIRLWRVEVEEREKAQEQLLQSQKMEAWLN
jgi:hypothetical protein